ncbi:hypothetical protein HBN50_03660 [Halobacteriovorax sp. GB3]|uniref:hypothetical protein n=1 Tax=Halobacteriovorax sp. GB3 TaxID=2719615 RepID=UPI00235E8004|nr:hypothetical protein [Halobacteriovorax sp. GB3]MDD0852175.1 hypothetical protein [Halobacteriovorax sp. GB3]
MIYKLLFLALIPTFSFAFNCERPIHEKETILFVDVNASYHEVESAQKAACQRGQQFVVVPKNTIELGIQREKLHRVKTRFVNCKSNCTSLKEKVLKESKKLTEMSYENDRPIIEELEERLSEISKNEGSLKSFILSGHNGGGSFSSDREIAKKLGKEELFSLFKSYPKLAKDVQSSLLLGCYTSVKKEVIDWKGLFPNIKILAGYEDQGPLSIRPAASQYVEDILFNEQKALDLANDRALQKLINHDMPSLYNVHSGIYFNLGCHDGKDLEYYYLSQGTNSERMASLSDENCETMISKGRQFADVYDYYYGIKKIPTNTKGTHLRDAYSFSRKNDYCYLMAKEDREDYYSLLENPSVMRNLLFYHPIKENFARAYKDQFKSAHEKIMKTDQGELLRSLESSLNSKRAELSTWTSFLDDFMANSIETVDHYRSYRDKGKKSYEKAMKDKKLQKALIQFRENGGKGRYDHKQRKYLEKVDNFLKTYEEGLSFLKEIDEHGVDGYIEKQRDYVVSIEKAIIRLEDGTQALRTFEKSGKRPWPLTWRNLQRKSKAEIDRNIHAIYSYAMLSNDEEVREYAKISDAILSKLTHAPHEWHEVLDQPDRPI